MSLKFGDRSTLNFNHKVEININVSEKVVLTSTLKGSRFIEYSLEYLSIAMLKWQHKFDYSRSQEPKVE